MCTRRNSAQSAERDNVCVKHKIIFDINLKRLFLEDFFCLDEGPRFHVVKKHSAFTQSSTSIPKACDGDFCYQDPQLMTHANEIFRHVEATALNNSWNNFDINDKKYLCS